MGRQVREDDLRLPEFRGAQLDELEFREDGKVVRKDRWEVGVRTIASALGFHPRGGFEVRDIVDGVRRLVEDMEGVRGAAADEIWKEMKSGN